MRRILILSAGLTLLVAALGSVARAQLAPAQLAAGIKVTGLDSLGRIAVSANFVVVAEDRFDSRVAVFDHAGTQLDTIANIPGPSGVALAGTTLYVAARGASAIYVYDLSTFPAVKIAAYSTSPMTEPTSLARAGGRLWFTATGQESSSYGVLGSMTTAGADVDVFTPEGYEYWQYPSCGDMDHSSLAAQILFVHGSGCGSPDVVYAYSAGASPPTRLGEHGWTSWGSYSSGAVTVAPDGDAMITYYEGDLAEFALDSLDGPVFTYQAPGDWSPHASAIASTSSGLIAAPGDVGRSGILLWEQDQVETMNAFAMPSGQGAVGRDSLAFDPTGSTLFAASSSAQGVFLHAIDPHAIGTSLDLDVSERTITYGDPVTFTATLSGPGAGAEVVISTVKSGVATPVSSCVTDGAGVCTWTTRPDGSASYRADFAGAGDFSPSSSSLRQVEVAPRLTGRMLRAYDHVGRYALYHENRRVFYQVVMRPPRPGKRIYIRLEFNFGDGWRNGGVEEFRQSDTGEVLIYFEGGSLPRGRYRLRGGYTGDATLVGAESAWSYFRVTA